jgi:hypothetical protein
MNKLKEKNYSTRFIPRFVKYEMPDNWLRIKHVHIFGIYIGILEETAKENYPWSCSCSYTGSDRCRAKEHTVITQ